MERQIRLAELKDKNAIVDLLNKVTVYLHKKGINQWTYPWDESEIKKDIEECFNYAMDFYKSEHCQVQELAVFILGHIASKLPEALSFLKETVSHNSDWKVQEILAMAFDCDCKDIGYENALPTINEWLSSDAANVNHGGIYGVFRYFK